MSFPAEQNMVARFDGMFEACAKIKISKINLLELVTDSWAGLNHKKPRITSRVILTLPSFISSCQNNARVEREEAYGT